MFYLHWRLQFLLEGFQNSVEVTAVSHNLETEIFKPWSAWNVGGGRHPLMVDPYHNTPFPSRERATPLDLHLDIRKHPIIRAENLLNIACVRAVKHVRPTRHGKLDGPRRQNGRYHGGLQNRGDGSGCLDIGHKLPGLNRPWSEAHSSTANLHLGLAHCLGQLNGDRLMRP
jgi:hypothetical protein